MISTMKSMIVLIIVVAVILGIVIIYNLISICNFKSVRI